MNDLLKELKKNSKDTESINTLLMQEYNHAWDTHRHHENLRARYVGFMFAVAFAGTALIGSQAKEIWIGNSFSIAINFFISIFSLLIIKTLLNIVNSMSYVFPHYENIWESVRLHFLNSEIERLLNVRKNELVLKRAESFGAGINKIGNALLTIYGVSSIAFLIWFLLRLQFS
ncbi:hypothetical protein BM526_02435 [Alteromonas mediterranea]|uniref:hypothetical protein n=1 Tax=Alteromonas mediterranea TaxID=314275 RepID=UPI00090375F5|nr:hypothetical protein [Alteromonas mediterranea]APE00814.1 hypothetical protein BM526_02435 [Alteromonas mediterranea]